MAKPLVLLLDDDPAILEAIPLEIRPEFNVECASTIQEAIEKIKAAKGTIDVAVVDMKLGDDWEGGLKAIQEIHSLDSAPEIIVLTAYGSQENIVECMEAGAFSYAEKSGRIVDGNVTGLLTATIRRALETHELRRQAELGRYLPSFIKCLAAVIDSHEPYKDGHSGRVAKCARIIAEEYDLSDQECKDIEMAGMIHDLGMIDIDINMLTRPGPLTNIEWAMIREHPREGERILKSIPELSHLIPAVVDHHERYDGQGYPNGKKGDEISIQGRILAVAEAFDAMVSKRPYQSTLSLDGAFHAISMPGSPSHRPGQFDPDVVEAFNKGFKRISAIYDPYYFGEQKVTRELTIVLSSIIDENSIIAEIGDLRYNQILEEYFQRVENLVRFHEGRIVKRLGDGFLAIFHEAPKAVNFAITLQRSLINNPILDGRLQIRLGIHKDKVDMMGTSYGGDIFGSGVELTAHLEHMAKSGEVILSGETYRCLPKQLAAYFKKSKPLTFSELKKPLDLWVYRIQGKGSDDVYR